ncbi:hypothetical protein F3087_35155 [Nocardia colli]|uniref:Uncharacterized protein n=1 Tax=Nocardia colli TaxID=2545717 RepID=A0A5N0E436_9NOCA|nr:hypothetical protein [Nocardia colli]KAA8884192.1 hypothetical protein F3087_35155 [Nocardia colli]
MTGGLRALVAAGRAQTPRLRPRPMSRFEPGGMGAADIDTEAVPQVRARTVEPTVSEAVRSESAPAPRPAAPPRPDAPVPRIRLRDRRIPEPDGADRSAVQAMLRPSAPVPAQPALAQDEREAARVPVARDETTDPSAVLRPAAPVPIAPAHDARERPTVIVAHNDSADEPVATRRREIPSEPPPTERPARPATPVEKERGALVPPRTPLPAVATSRTGRRIDQRAPEQDSPTHDSVSEPVVQVSIGRIEVRATQTPAAAPAESGRRSAVIGLDDYLSQRGAR